MLTKNLASLLLLASSFTGLLAQASPAPVSSPQRGTTYADETGVWYEQPFVWIGLAIVVLTIVLLVIKRKNTPVRNRLHKY